MDQTQENIQERHAAHREHIRESLGENFMGKTEIFCFKNSLSRFFPQHYK